jgi:Holliday junction resolvase
MIKRYVKGAQAERDLAKLLKNKSFSVIRAAGSGSSISTPDLIAIKRGRILAFECKAWKTVPRLKEKEYKDFLNWCKGAGAIGFLAWKNKDWLFMNIKDLKKSNIKKDGMSLKDLMFVVDI